MNPKELSPLLCRCVFINDISFVDDITLHPIIPEKKWAEELTYDFVHELIKWPRYVQQVKDAEEAPEDVGVLASVTAAVSAPEVAAVPTMSHAESLPAQKVEEKTQKEPPKVTAAEQEVFGQNVLLIKPY